MTVARSVDAARDVAKEAVRVPGLGVRHVQVFLYFSLMVIGYCLRVCMSEGIVAMTDTKSRNDQVEVYNWTSSEQTQIISSFFWGYTVMQIPSGYIASVWSAQKLLSFGIFICGVFNILTPLAAHYGGMIAVCVCRVGMGLSQSCLLPCIQTLLSKWAPPSERARLGSLAYAGAQFGTVITFPIAGLLAASTPGWPTMFYVFGALAAFLSIVFYIFAYDNPSMHPKISGKEKDYIELSLQGVQDSKEPHDEEKLKTPWKAIFTSVPMWALIIAHCGQNWGYWSLLNDMPSYMNHILKFDIAQNGAMAALPYLCMWILSFPVSWLSDFALQKGVSKEVARKVCNTIAYWGPAVALICLGALKVRDSTTAVIILVVAVGLNAGSLCGFQINHIDLSPNFAGTMMSITNCIASVIAIIAPLIRGVIVADQEDVTAWCRAFFLSGAIYLIGNLVFIIFGKAEVQPWNDPRPSTSRKESSKEAAVP